MSKKLLNESTIRKFMKLANIDRLADGFVNEASAGLAGQGGNKYRGKSHPDHRNKKAKTSGLASQGPGLVKEEEMDEDMYDEDMREEGIHGEGMYDEDIHGEGRGGMREEDMEDMEDMEDIEDVDDDPDENSDERIVVVAVVGVGGIDDAAADPGVARTAASGS